MSSTTFYRLSGLALLLGGTVGLVESLLSAVLYPGHQATPQQISSWPWMLLAFLYLAGFLLLAIGLPGLHRRQAPRTGGWGVAAFIFLLVGEIVGGVLFGLLQVATMPQQAHSQPGAASSQPPAAAFILFVTIPVLLLAIGAILLGVASLRAMIYPKGAGALLLVAGIFALVSLAIPLEAFQNVMEVLWNGMFFLAFGWFGASLAAQGKASTPAPNGATPVAQQGR